MRRIGDPTFFRVFDALVSEAAASGCRLWEVDGVRFVHHRYSSATEIYGFGLDTYTLCKPRSRPWSLLVAREFWWGDATDSALRSGRWAKQLGGSRTAMLSWFDAQQLELRAAGLN